MRRTPVAAAIAVLVLACAAAAVQGFRATNGLAWPGDPDFARDIAAAENVAAGHALSDPFYRDEWAWYNPLVPTLVSGAAVASGRPVPQVYARLGAYLNLAAPIALFVLVLRWWGPAAAVASVLAMLFLIPGNDPGWLAATYSPWLFPMHVGQALCYLGLMALAAAWRGQSLIGFALAGVAVGAAFLAHTAPALILGTAMAAEALWRAVGKRDERGGIILGLIAFAVAAVVVSAPYLFSIAGHYRLHIRNAAPLAFVAPELALDAAWSFARRSLSPSAHGLIAVAGWFVLVRRRQELEARLLLFAALASAALVLHGYVVQTIWARDVGLTAIVPAHHFVYYLRAFEAIAFGVGLIAVAEWIGRRVAAAHEKTTATRTATIGLVAATAIAAAWEYPAYARRSDFVFERRVAERKFADPDLRGLYDWIRTATSAQDVFVAPLNTGQYVVGAAGRKVVAVDKLFSNPYVDWSARATDREELERRFDKGEWTPFLNLAARQRVRYVLRHGRLPPELTLPSFVSVAWTSGDWTVYRVGP